MGDMEDVTIRLRFAIEPHTTVEWDGTYDVTVEGLAVVVRAILTVEATDDSRLYFAHRYIATCGEARVLVFGVQYGFFPQPDLTLDTPRYDPRMPAHEVAACMVAIDAITMYTVEDMLPGRASVAGYDGGDTMITPEDRELFTRSREKVEKLRRAGALGAPRPERSKAEWAALYGAPMSEDTPEARAHNRTIMRAAMDAGELRPWCEAHGLGGSFYRVLTVLLREAGNDIVALED